MSNLCDFLGLFDTNREKVSVIIDIPISSERRVRRESKGSLSTVREQSDLVLFSTEPKPIEVAESEERFNTLKCVNFNQQGLKVW